MPPSLRDGGGTQRPPPVGRQHLLWREWFGNGSSDPRGRSFVRTLDSYEKGNRVGRAHPSKSSRLIARPYVCQHIRFMVEARLQLVYLASNGTSAADSVRLA